MAKTLAELRQSSRTSLPERTYEICLSQALVGEVQALRDEKANLELAAKQREDENAPAQTARKMSEGVSPRIAEIDTRLEQIYDEMREHTGTLLLRGITGGDWRRWCDEHPARTEGRDDRGRPILVAIDESVGYGYCDASALMERLGDFVAAWNDAPLETGDWDWLEEKAPPGDIKEMARWVVQMHESVGVKALPKESKPSSSDRGKRDRLTLARALAISEKRLLGWEPSELHQHFDTTGRLTGVTLVKYEPEWDDASRDDMLALGEYEAGICDCGFHESLTHDKQNVFTFDEKVCPVCAGVARFGRIQADRDHTIVKTFGDEPPPGKHQPSDGRRTFTRIMSDEEVAAKDPSRSPAPADPPVPG